MKELLDVEDKPIHVGDKVVFNTGKHDAGVHIGIVTKLTPTSVRIKYGWRGNINSKHGYSETLKSAEYVYVIR